MWVVGILVALTILSLVQVVGWASCRLADGGERYPFNWWIFLGPWIYSKKVGHGG